jgi:excisionase family DNA binding protein
LHYNTAKACLEAVMSTDWLTVEEIANELRVNEGTVRGWIRNKKLKAAKFGRDYRIRRVDYEKFIQEHLNVEDDTKK